MFIACFEEAKVFLFWSSFDLLKDLTFPEHVLSKKGVLSVTGRKDQNENLKSRIVSTVELTRLGPGR